MKKLELKTVTVEYEKNRPILQNISFTVEPGEFIVLLGASGCGKTTLLNSIAGIVPIKSGELYINDQYSNNKSIRDRDIAMVFQNYALYPSMTVFENIAFPLHNLKKKNIDKVVIIDELADLLIVNKNLEKTIIRLTQIGRSAGIHIIAGTQRLHSDTLSTTLLFSFPSKVCFKVDIKQQSENFFGYQGAELLKGFGDMLYYKHSNTELLNLTTIYYSLKDIYNNFTNKGIECYYPEEEGNLEDIFKNFNSEIRFILGDFDEED